MKLKGKVTAISGAGSGIGRCAATLFAQNGAVVYLLEVNEKAGVDTEKEIRAAGGEARFIKTDVADAQSVQAAFERIEKEAGRLDVLYNNASVFLGGEDGAISDISLETWGKVIGINLNGMFHCSKYGLPLMLKSGGGAVINTASSAAIQGVPRCDAYTATKGAAAALTRSMAVEYGPSGIRVNCIAPVAIRTPMVLQSNTNDDSFDEKRFLETGTPLRRWGEPEEIAKVALFLASDDASYINGAVIVADGGITVTYPFTKPPEYNVG